MVLQLYRSNCMERLADALARCVRTPLANVLAPECIAVPSAGMERWLALELASRLGVWANPEFPFPGKLVETLVAALVPEPRHDPENYAPLRVQFALASLLRELAPQPEFSEVRNYLADEREPAARRFGLAARLALLFDRYLTYRPELALAWQAGSNAQSAWQAALFRALSARLGPHHLAARARAAQRALAAGARIPDSVPERIHVFGVSSLPPEYLALLSAVSEQREVNLFVLSPCREYFGDLRAAREQRRAALTDTSGLAHALLASLGRHSREFQDLIEGQPYREPEPDLYVDPGHATLLRALQSELLCLHEREVAPTIQRRLLDRDDDSLAIHACHSPLRELEVLHDQLLALISDHGIEPHQIIVLTPDIQRYAPLIEAVFARSAARPSIPYRIAGQSPRTSSSVLRASDALLALLGSRFGASQVLDLLGLDPVRERLAIGMDELEQLCEWVADSGIRWGVDAEHRVEVGQPARAENTWRFGLGRLALGYASGAGPEALFQGCAPLAIDSGDADLLGRLLEFCEGLFAFRLELREPCRLGVWRERLGRLVQAFVREDRATAGEHAAFRQALFTLERQALAAGFDEPISLASMRQLLALVLDGGAALHGFLAGGVTFCQLVPMRSIPFEVVCVLGLNDGVFPALDSPLEFDLLAKERKPGDRTRRDDDRQLLLEALLSARQKLLLSYVGQSVHDGQPRLPSILLSELIDQLARSWPEPAPAPAAPGAEARLQPAASALPTLEQRLVVRHALSAVSPRYFAPGRDPRLFSYAVWALDGARASCGPRTPPPAFFRAPVSALIQPPASIELAELEVALTRPQRTFARQKLNLALGTDLLVLTDREPFELDALERWKLATDLLGARVDRALEPGQQPVAASGSDAELEREYLRELPRGRLPLGTPGRLEYRELQAQVGSIERGFVGAAGGALQPALDVELQWLGTHLFGRLEQLWPSAQLRVQYSKSGGRHELRHFVRHLVMLSQRAEPGNEQLPEVSCVIARGDGGVAQIEFGPLADAKRQLWELIGIYAGVLVQPLPLFEHASRAYAEQLAGGKSEDKALGSARQKFNGSQSGAGRGDLGDLYVQRFFPDFDAVLQVPVPFSFEALARRVYLPLLQCRGPK